MRAACKIKILQNFSDVEKVVTKQERARKPCSDKKLLFMEQEEETVKLLVCSVLKLNVLADADETAADGCWTALPLLDQQSNAAALAVCGMEKGEQ